MNGWVGGWFVIHCVDRREGGLRSGPCPLYVLSPEHDARYMSPCIVSFFFFFFLLLLLLLLLFLPLSPPSCCQNGDKGVGVGRWVEERGEEGRGGWVGGRRSGLGTGPLFAKSIYCLVSVCSTTQCAGPHFFSFLSSSLSFLMYAPTHPPTHLLAHRTSFNPPLSIFSLHPTHPPAYPQMAPTSPLLRPADPRPANHPLPSHPPTHPSLLLIGVLWGLLVNGYGPGECV